MFSSLVLDHSTVPVSLSPSFLLTLISLPSSLSLFPLAFLLSPVYLILFLALFHFQSGFVSLSFLSGFLLLPKFLKIYSLAHPSSHLINKITMENECELKGNWAIGIKAVGV